MTYIGSVYISGPDLITQGTTANSADCTPCRFHRHTQQRHTPPTAQGTFTKMKIHEKKSLKQSGNLSTHRHTEESVREVSPESYKSSDITREHISICGNAQLSVLR